MAYSPEGNYLAAGSGDGAVRIWAAGSSTRRAEWTNQQSFSSHSAVTTLAWSPDGKSLAVGYADGTLRVWDSVKNMQLLSLRDHSDWVTSIAWSPDGKTFASGSKDERARYYRGTEQGILEAHTGPITSLSFSYDGNFLGTKSLDATIRIWRTRNWETVATIQESSSDYAFSCISFNPKRLVLATLGRDGAAIDLWDVDGTYLSEAPPVVPTVFYTNAKVLLVGDSGVGKSGLALVLTGQPFVATHSTHARFIWTLDTKDNTQR